VTNTLVSLTKRLVSDRRLSPDAALLIRQYATWLAFSLVAVLINSASGVADAARSGSVMPAWHHYGWELTSWFAYVLVTPATFWLDNAAAARSVRLPVRLLGYAGFSLIFSGLHIAFMLGSRPPVFALLGDHYEIGSWAGRFAYEYPKDIVAYLIVLGIAVFWRRSAVAEAAPVATAAAPSFLVRAAAGETLIHAHEIDWVEAQGNYVALHVAGRTHLVRRTMAEVEDKLSGFGFVRTHRSALVGVRRMRGLAHAGGALFVILDSDERVPLSQSRKSAVRAALQSGGASA
jgi:hypothetical protein